MTNKYIFEQDNGRYGMVLDYYIVCWNIDTIDRVIEIYNKFWNRNTTKDDWNVFSLHSVYESKENILKVSIMSDDDFDRFMDDCIYRRDDDKEIIRL